ncbi:hypothetical protein T440DRAFT_507199 [Plenodomus tracheiphilus IPT5]|uniref:Metallo-beta-lactamase domain-containing protein n=1 Tax=Plenodomus tracheiphilus IPT5 TaxID=1408161 RepID=A0A6A7B8W6_9PLEO|nr:hypothetical protein T440DRAFT_507199 [Plenodomus tracheiphilus IPT5]
MDATLEFFGATTFRLRANGITIFHDAWLDKPALMQRHLEIEEVKEADYIFISHAHFDHLPGADLLARSTGAIVVANCEAINLLRQAGVPETQLQPVSGGERLPLFTRAVRASALRSTCALAPGPPGAPPVPHPALAALAVHVWPSLHCLMPGTSHADIPDIFDAGKEYHGEASQYTCTADITRGMQYGLMRLSEIVPPEHMDEKMKAFVDYMSDTKRNVMSNCDGGQLMYNILVGDKSILFNSHLGAYEGIMRSLEPKPEVVVLGIAGRANLNGRPYNGSAAQFAVKQVEWLGKPEKVIWCLHDESLIAPFRVDTSAATEAIETETKAEVVELSYAKPYTLFR